MNFVALDATKLIILMVAGGGFALAGLWLMFRPKPEGGAAKLELFGAKFEASSAGLLVFLIGAGFLAVPLFVPEKQVDVVSPTRPTASAQPASGEPRQTTASAARTERPAKPSTSPNAEIQVEPKGSFASAKVVPLGDSVSGQVSGHDAEFYSVAISPEQQGEIVASIVAIKDNVVLTLFDEDGSIIGDSATGNGGQRTATISRVIESNAYRAMVHSKFGNDAAYTLTIGVRQ